MTMEGSEITIAVGAQFESFASFRDTLSQYEKAKKVIFVKSSSKLLRRNSPIFPTLKYDFVIFECKQGEKRAKSRCTGIRPNQRSIKLGCRAKIRLATHGHEGNWFLKVTTCHLEHSNHLVPVGDKDSNDNSQCFDGQKGEPGEDVGEGAFNNHSSNYNYETNYSAPSTSTETYPSSFHPHNSNYTSNVTNSGSSTKRKRKPKHDLTESGEDKRIEDEVLALVHKRLLQTPTHQQQSTGGDNNDELVSFGRHVTNKLRKMSNDQRIFAEKLINDALYEGALGSLSRSVSLNWNHPTPVPIHMLPPI